MDRIEHQQRSIELVDSTLAARRACHRARLASFGNDQLGLVAVRHNLHEGHLSLVRKAREECGVVVVVFDQPLSENATRIVPGEGEDPDADTLARAGANILFRPPAPVFDPESATRVVTTEESTFSPSPDMLTFFVTLLHIFSPERLYFGELDAVVFAGLRRALRDLAITTRLVSATTAHNESGFPFGWKIPAAQHRAALAIPQALEAMRHAIAEGKTGREAVLRAGTNVIKRHPELKLEYLDTLNTDTLQRADRVERGVLVVIAARLGSELLNDTFCVE